MSKLLLLVSLLLLSLWDLAPAHADTTTLSLTQIMPEQVVFDWSANPCAQKYIPDGPARGFRRKDGKFVLLAEEADNWEMVGNSPFDLKISCPSILSSASYGLLNRGYTGIIATYTEDGQTIYGVAGQDLTPIITAMGCVDRGTGNCWLNDLTGVVSTDMGKTFNFTSSTNGDIASLVAKPVTTMPGVDGYTSASNIIKRDGFYYMLIHVNNTYAADGWTCLARTNTLKDPSSWRGYDGTGYTAILKPPADPLAIPCAAVGNNSLYPGVTSFNYIPKKHLYIAVFQYAIRVAGDTQDVPGAYYATSSDMIHWNPPVRIMKMQWDARYATGNEVDGYPVLMDPFSKSRNFDTIDSDTPVLIFTAMQVINGALQMNRNIVAIPFLMK